MLRTIALLLLLLPASAGASDVPDPAPQGDRWPTSEDEVPAPEGEDGDGGDSDDHDVPPPDGDEEPPDAEVPPPHGAPGAPDVPPPDGPTAPAEPFPGEPGAAPGPTDPAEPFPDAAGDAPAPAHATAPSADDPLAQPTDALYAAGLSAFEQLDFAGAVPFFEEVLRREADHSGARNYLVESLLNLERAEAAAAIREGAVPPGEPTAVVVPPAEPKTKRSHNPRADRRFTAGVALGGSAVGVGVFAEFRPAWMVAVSGGFGGLPLIEGRSVTGIGAVHLQADILPVPFYVSPVVGAGIAAAFGDAIWRTDGFLKAAVTGPDFRLVPYVQVGARLDVGRMHLSGGIWLVPTGDLAWPLLPLPGARLGLSF